MQFYPKNAKIPSSRILLLTLLRLVSSYRLISKNEKSVLCSLSLKNFNIERPKTTKYPSWGPRDIQRWKELFQRFDVFQRWFRKHEKHQRWSALFQTWSALTFSESTLFRTEKFSADQHWKALFQRESMLNQRSSALIFLASKSWDLLWISSNISTYRWEQ